MFRSRSLGNKEIMALYAGGGRDEGCISEEDVDSEGSEEGKGGRGVRSSLSLEIHGLQREQQVRFSNQEYYRRLEELKSAHLRNMAELERMYISQDDGGQRGRDREDRLSISGPARRLQRINSQEELDFHDTSSGSDQSELSLEDGTGGLHWTASQDRTFERNVLLSPEQMTTQKQFRFQPKASCPKPPTRPTGARTRPNAKVTVPKPFQMMLREEERKRHKVRTRSEIELENSLLRRELEELRECQKKFRASPAPAHIHLPLYEMISRRSNQSGSKDGKSQKASAAASPQPFNFMEREKRKREAKIVAELGNFGKKVERRAFKARPMPSSVYGSGRKTTSICPLEREATEGHSDPNSDLEAELYQSDASSDSSGPQRCSSSKPVKKHIELSIEMVKEQGWSYVCSA